MISVIKNANVVTDKEVIRGGSVSIENGYIKEVGFNLAGDEVIDAKGGYVIPGFIDLHCHGGMGLDFIDCSKSEMKELESFHLSHGTTTLLATTLTASPAVIEKSLSTIEEYKKENEDGTIIGVHMEGPWFSASQAGAQDPDNMQEPTADSIEKIAKAHPLVLRVSAAPEIDKDFAFGKKAKELGLIVSAGHTDADFDTIVKAYENGYNLLTHFYSGMKGVERKNCYRIAGAVEAGYYLDGMNVEIISDGKHLPQSLLKLIYKLKGADKISLITDATRGCGMKDGEKIYIGPKESPLPSIVKDGVAFLEDMTSFAGSASTFHQVYKVMAKAVDNDMVALSKMASLNPAKILGLNDRGAIKQGKRADLLILDESLEIRKILLKGKEIK